MVSRQDDKKNFVEGGRKHSFRYFFSIVFQIFKPVIVIIVPLHCAIVLEVLFCVKICCLSNYEGNQSTWYQDKVSS